MRISNNVYISLIIICLLMFSCAYGLKANALNYGTEFLGASIGDVLFYLPPSILIADATQGMDEPNFLPFSGGYIVGGCIGAPLGTVVIGKSLHYRGSILGAWTGGIVGTGLGILTLAAEGNYDIGEKIPYILYMSTALLLPPVCSVIGYNLFPHKNNSQSMFFNKNLPRLELTVLREKRGDKISPKIGASITFKF